MSLVFASLVKFINKTSMRSYWSIIYYLSSRLMIMQLLVCACDQRTLSLSAPNFAYYRSDKPNFFVHIHDCMLKDVCDSQFLKNLKKTFF